MPNDFARGVAINLQNMKESPKSEHESTMAAENTSHNFRFQTKDQSLGHVVLGLPTANLCLAKKVKESKF